MLVFFAIYLLQCTIVILLVRNTNHNQHHTPGSQLVYLQKEWYLQWNQRSQTSASQHPNTVSFHCFMKTAYYLYLQNLARTILSIKANTGTGSK
jgi:hypothetical protein